MVVELVGTLSESLPRDHEVIVSLDRNRLQPSEEAIVGGFPATARLLLSDSGWAQGPAKARNRGVAKSRGDVLVFIDSDIAVPFSFAPELVARLQNTNQPDVTTTRITGIYQNIISDFFTDHTFRVRKVQGRLLFPSAILGIGRSLYERVGGFDEDFPDAGGEDWDFLIRLNDLPPGLSVGYHADIRAFHLNPSTLQELLNRALRYGLHANRYLEKGKVRKGRDIQLAQIVLRNIAVPVNRMAVRLENMVRGKLWPQEFRPLSLLKFGVFRLIRVFQETEAPINRSPQEFILADRVLFRLRQWSGASRQESPGATFWEITNSGSKIFPDIPRGYPPVSTSSSGMLSRRLLKRLWRFTHRGGVIVGYSRALLRFSASRKPRRV